MRRQPGWDDPLYSAKPASHARSGIGDRPSTKRRVLIRKNLSVAYEGATRGRSVREFLKHSGGPDTSNS